MGRELVWRLLLASGSSTSTDLFALTRRILQVFFIFENTGSNLCFLIV